ncbi:DMT family transporter [Rhodopila sp.]|uniref:DMT family transporter n=1 Tax=Rhodopila sp. TaxID=2480087 RepID=UPI002CFFE4A1|nr:DMT family transporter [Rhodopila sp.]HVZ06487.1 DMT family transporter [Rhodopila sp.]
MCVAFTALGWGLNWPATKLLLAAFPPLSARGVSGCVACLILSVAAMMRRQSLTVPRRDWGWLVLGSLLNVTVWMGGTTASLRWLPAGQAATLAYTMPIWVCLLAWLILRETPRPRHILAIGMGMLGVIVLLGGGRLSPYRHDGPGLALALLSATSFAFGTVQAKARPLGLQPLALTAWQVGLGSIPLGIAGWLWEEPSFRGLPPFGWAVLGYTALVSMGLCYVTWFMARSRLSALGAATGTLLTPVIGVTASALLLGDSLGWSQLVSIGLVGGGILLSAQSTGASRPAGRERR